MSPLSPSVSSHSSSTAFTSSEIKRRALENALEDRQARLASAPTDFERTHLRLGIGVVQVMLGNLSEPAVASFPISNAGLARLYDENA